ncbi:MAG: phosphopantetheine-binding protein [Xenophilus sp.]
MTSDGITFQTLSRILQDEHHVDPARIQRGTALADLGLDSLALMEFVFSAEDALRLRLPEDRLDPRAAGITLGDLCDAIDVYAAGQHEVPGRAAHA